MSLPDTYRDEWEMARTLASYIDCPYRIRREVKIAFGRVMPVDSIRKLRERHLAPAKPADPYRPHEVHDALKESREAAGVNMEFLHRIMLERARCW